MFISNSEGENIKVFFWCNYLRLIEHMSKKTWCLTEKRMNVCTCNSKKISIRNCKGAKDREGLRCPHDVQNRFGSPTYQSHVVRSKCIYIYTHFYFCSCIFIIQSKYIDWCLDYNKNWILSIYKSVHFLGDILKWVKISHS